MQILNIDKLSFTKLCDSKLAGLHAFYNMAISLSQKKGKKLKKKNFMPPFMEEVQVSQGCRASTRRQFTFYQLVRGSSSYSFFFFFFKIGIHSMQG